MINMSLQTAVSETLIEKRRRLDALLREAALLLRATPDFGISYINIDREGVATFRIIPGVELP